MVFSPLRIMSTNVSSMKSPHAMFQVYQALEHSSADIIFLQETRLGSSVDLRRASREWHCGPSFFSIAPEPGAGVGILFRGHSGIQVHRLVEVEVGRCLLLDVSVAGRRLRLINTYGPQSGLGRRTLLRELQQYLHTSIPVIWAGDFNQVLNAADRSGRFFDKHESHFLKNMLQQADMVDVFTHDGRVGKHTYHCAGKSSRLDMAFVQSGEVFTEVEEVLVDYSDHLALSFLLGASSVPAKGRGLWRLSAESLEGEAVRHSFEALLQLELTRTMLFDSMSQWWEEAKESFRNFFHKLSVVREGNKYKKYLSLRKKLESYILDGVAGDKVSQLKLLIREHQYSRYRSLVLERDYGGFHSPDPFRNCRESVEKKVITGLKDSQGIVQTSKGGILRVVQAYYADLFKSKALEGEKIKAFLEGTPGPDLQNLDFSSLVADITEDEVKMAIDQLHLKKAPGPDGLTAEFYKTFKDLLAPILVEVFRDCLGGGVLPPSMRLSSLVLLSKGKEPSDVKNWRPIALLNTDRKLLAKVLFSRLILFSGTLLSHEQFCTVKGRSIFGALLSIREVLETCKAQSSGRYVLGLDQAKAFDRVDHQYLWATLRKYGIPDQFVEWLTVLYREGESFPLVNGWRGENFRVETGVRQGCPLSPLLYVFAIDPFLRAVQALDLEGFRAPRCLPLKLVAYADDVTVVVSHPEEVNLLTDAIESYSEASGSLVNTDKSEAFWTVEGEPDFPLPDFQLASKEISILGVKFGREDNSKLNWESKLDAVNARVQRWKKWRLSYRERVKLIKTYLVPLLLYVSFVYPLPEAFYARIHSLFFQMLWGSRLNPVKRGITYLRTKEGGLDMLCPVAFFGTIFLKFNFGHLGQRTEVPWQSSVRAWVSHFVGDWLQGDRVKQVRVRHSHLPSYFVLGLKLLRRWDIRVDDLGTASRRALYMRVLDVYFAIPLALRDCVGNTLVRSLRFLNSKRLPPKLFDLSWLSLQGKLFVRGNVKYLSVVNRNCPWGCGVEESQEHFLQHCPLAKSVRSQVSRALCAPLLGTLGYAELAYGVSAQQHSHDHETLYLVITVYRYHLWHGRCRYSFGSDVTPENIAKSIMVELRYIRSLESARSSCTPALWGGFTL
uniref:Reverse transcriptase domain-containing protein n=1 Tax=Xenopus tropicalis TaxID=8364 RepID=A0A803K9P7_XENTR